MVSTLDDSTHVYFLFHMLHLCFCPIKLDVKINLYQCQYNSYELVQCN